MSLLGWRSHFMAVFRSGHICCMDTAVLVSFFTGFVYASCLPSSLPLSVLQYHPSTTIFTTGTANTPQTDTQGHARDEARTKCEHT